MQLAGSYMLSAVMSRDSVTRNPPFTRPRGTEHSVNMRSQRILTGHTRTLAFDSGLRS
jgi:hypothetical protein